MTLALVAAVALLAVPALAFDDVFQQTYPLAAGGSFQLQNVNGSVFVSGWDRNEVEVYAKKSARSSQHDLPRVTIEVQARPDAVSVQTRYPQDDAVEVYVEYHVRVPHRVQLGLLATVNGEVRVFGVEGSGQLRSVNGNIEVSDSDGRLSARTTNGDVHIELHRLDPSEPLVLETVNGSVVLALPADAGAELEARSLNGDVRSELPMTTQSSLGAGAIRARIGSGGGRVRIRTVNGMIRVVAAIPTV